MVWWMYEGLIWLFLIVVGAALIDIYTKYGKKVFKQRTLLLAAVVLSLSWVVVFYGSFIEPRRLLVHYQAIEVSGLSQPLRVALLSDLHVGPYKGAAWVKEIVEKTNEEQPDLIILLGDYVFGALGDVDKLTPLGDFAAPLGVYAVLGNHDYDVGRQTEIRDKLESLGIKTLVDASTEIVLANGATLCLAGLNDLWNGFSLDAAFSDCPEDQPTILLSHNPDVVLFDKSLAADLIISGHTHGGQIRLPLVGPVAYVPSVLPKEYLSGFFNLAGTKVFVTTGLGETGPRARLFNPPEIAVLELN